MDNPPPSIRDQYARVVLLDYQDRYGSVPNSPPLPQRDGNAINVGILGGGSAGLYAAMLLSDINNKFQTNFTFDILEANPKRLGGRLYSQPIGTSPDTSDYIDVGAMRFPQIPIMERTFTLFQKLNINTSTDKNPPNGSLIPYIMSTDQNLNFFNEIIKTNAELNTQPPPPDPFNTKEMTQPPEQVIESKIGIYKQKLENNLRAEWPTILELDGMSMRSFLASPLGGFTSQKTINTLETLESGTNFYDSALLEMIMEDMTFHWYSTPDPKVDWFTVQGGSSEIANAMASGVKDRIKMGNAVTAISPNLAQDGSWTSVNVDVLSQGATSPTTTIYDHVISTLPLGCFIGIDTSKCNFDWDLRQAIRSLQYGNSVKVGIRFKYRWWETEQNQVGGVSPTDRPTRMAVYPSYGHSPNGDVTGTTMLVSYSWGQDANRLGALCQGPGTPEEQRLLDLIMRDLSDMHGITDYGHLPSLYVDHFAWNWDVNEYSAGAFALFGPGQFRSLYPRVTASFGGLLHFAGEATSVHHAWLVGALNSAFRAVYQILYAEKVPNLDDILNYLQQTWGKDEEFNKEVHQKQLEIGRYHPIANQGSR